VVETPLQFAAALWNKEHPNNQVKLVLNQAIPFASFLAKLTTAFVGHNPPDIAYGASGWPFPEARGGYLAPINQLTPQWIKNVYDKYFYPSLRNEMPVINGNIYALPTQSGGIDGLWYRKDWFQANHLPVPNTWKNLLYDAKFFAQPQIEKKYHLVAPFFLAASATQPMQTGYEGLGFIYAAGGHVIDHNRVTVDSPAVIKALTFLRSLRTQGLLPKIALTTTATGGVALLAKGELPMAVDGTWQYIALQQDNHLTSQQMQKEFAWIPFPRMNSHSTPVTSTTGANNLMIAKSPVDKIAAELVELSLSPTVEAEEAKAERAMIAKDGLIAAPAVEVPDMPIELKDMVGPAAEVAFVRSVVVKNMPYARQSLSFTYGAPVQTEVGHLIDSAVFGSTPPAVAAKDAALKLESETGLP
jgi:ABC-type glycerol-3-phosphate transport system substrate-binding protein